MVRIEKLENALQQMSVKALMRFMKRCACISLQEVGGSDSEVRAALDMVYLECNRRGKERLYDSVYANISSHPECCDIH